MKIGRKTNKSMRRIKIRVCAFEEREFLSNSCNPFNRTRGYTCSLSRTVRCRINYGSGFVTWLNHQSTDDRNEIYSPYLWFTNTHNSLFFFFFKFSFISFLMRISDKRTSGNRFFFFFLGRKISQPFITYRMIQQTML